ncbi:MAG: ATP-binding domain-containing protein [Prevotellaceae bacterium]|jgi:hypothetical protein|nr:ATP-binding domain-containing protein [Prevotellaceae bacterium]
MRLDNWFITNPDTSQQEVLKVPINENLIVKGAAGSGKTNMAIYRANQAGDNTFVIVVYTVALKKMVRYGLSELGLDKDRVVHEWSWINRGIEISGDVFCFGKRCNYECQFCEEEAIENKTIERTNHVQYERIKKHPCEEECLTNKCQYNPDFHKCDLQSRSCADENILILKVGNTIRYFAYSHKYETPRTMEGKYILGEKKKIDAGIYNKIVNDGKYMSSYGQELTIRKKTIPLEISIDFDDWVHDRFYYNFYRRSHWFTEIEVSNFHFDQNAENIVFIPAGYLFKDKGIVNYIIVDEGQDFTLSNYSQNFIPQATKSISIFGDTNQKIYSDRNCNIEDIATRFNYPMLNLNFNYRVPKTIAKVAQTIPNPQIDLIANNKKNNGNSDYPSFPKPIIKKCDSEKDELQYILNRIQTEGLDDVAILLPKEEKIKEIQEFFSQNNIGTQVRIAIDIGETPLGNRKFHRIDTLDFTNLDLPSILTYHSAKGTEFDNVFIPFADDDNGIDRNAFYVAVTRSSSRLFVTYSRELTHFIEIDENVEHISKKPIEKCNQNDKDIIFSTQDSIIILKI